MLQTIMKFVVSAFIALFFTSMSFSQGDKISGLIEDLEKHLKGKRIPGAMISIVSRNSILFQGGIGFANIETKEFVNGDHLFRLGSVSKSFTSLALLRALGDSPFDLDTPIREIDIEIPFTNPWEDTHPVRVKHLLEHTAGFEDFHPKAMYNRTDSIEPTAAEMVFSNMNSLVSRWKPGTMKAYCNPGFIVAGHLIEKLTGESYGNYIDKSILEPLGMSSSGYYFKKPDDRVVAQGYYHVDGEQYAVSFRSIQGGPAGGFCSNAKDMGAYLRFMLSRQGSQIDSSIFRDEVFDRIENAESTIAAEAGLLGGYGLGNFSIWKNGHLFYGHDGGIDGFMSRYVYSRDADLGVSVSINRMGNATEIVDIIIKHLLGGQEKIERSTKAIPEEIRSKYAGFYGFRNSKRELFSFTDIMLAGLMLDFQGDSILVKGILGKQKYTLKYAGEHQFFLGDEEQPSVMLLESEEGTPVLWINDCYTEMESKAVRLTSSLIIFFSLITPFFFMTFSFFRTLIRAIQRQKMAINHPIIWLASISYTLILVGFSGALSDPFESGIFNEFTALVYISSLALFFFTVVSVVYSIKTLMKSKTDWFHPLMSFCFCILTGFFWTYGFIGLKLWEY